MAFVYVGAGGFVGSCLRYAFNLLCRDLGAAFPLATLLSNIVAGLMIGFVLGIDRHVRPFPPNVRLLLTTGLPGGLSTFSTFSVETMDLFLAGRYAACALSVGLNLSLSILGVCVGIAVAKAAFAR